MFMQNNYMINDFQFIIRGSGFFSTEDGIDLSPNTRQSSTTNLFSRIPTSINIAKMINNIFRIKPENISPQM